MKNLIKNKKIKTILILVISLFLAITSNINLDKNILLKNSVNVDQIYIIILTILYFNFINNIRKYKNKRLNIISVLLAIIFATFQIIGYTIDTYTSIIGIIENKDTLVKNILKFISYSINFYIILTYLLNKILPKIEIQEKEEKEYKYFTDNKKSFFIIALIIFTAFIPYFLHEYPGIYTYDSVAEMNFTISNLKITNHHPVLHIFIISIFIKIGMLLDNIEIGIALFSITQMIAVSCFFSYILRYMVRKKVKVEYRFLTFISFILYPIFGIYSVTMWKDVPFAMMLTLFVIQIIEIITNNEYLRKPMNIIKFIIITILTILFRNNGIYIVLITLLSLIIALKGNKKTISLMLIGIIIFYGIWKGPIFNILNIKDGPIREMMSIPVQQIARAVKYRGKEISNEEYNEIKRFINMEREEMETKYNPRISDNIKDNFQSEEFKENKTDFIKLWMKLLIKFPKEFVEAFLDNSYGYWYPEETNPPIPTWYDYKHSEKYVKFNKQPLVKIEALDDLYEIINNPRVSIVSLTISIGFMFWINIICIGYYIFKKKYKLILAHIPILALWLTTIASPVWCEYRYIYAIFLTIPIYVFLNVAKANEKQIDNK